MPLPLLLAGLILRRLEPNRVACRPGRERLSKALATCQTVRQDPGDISAVG